MKRKGTTKAAFQLLQTLFRSDIKTVVTLENIPASLILNWDQTGLHYVQTPLWTLEGKGHRKSPLQLSPHDKQQLTAVFTCSLAGDFLSPQIIYREKMPACLPKTIFPPDWPVTYAPNHWANEETMMDYARCILLPYIWAQRRALKLSDNQPALAILDQFEDQLTSTFQDLFTANKICIVEVPLKCYSHWTWVWISPSKTASSLNFNRGMQEMSHNQACWSTPLKPCTQLSTLTILWSTQ